MKLSMFLSIAHANIEQHRKSNRLYTKAFCQQIATVLVVMFTASRTPKGFRFLIGQFQTSSNIDSAFLL